MEWETISSIGRTLYSTALLTTFSALFRIALAMSREASVVRATYWLPFASSGQNDGKHLQDVRYGLRVLLNNLLPVICSPNL